MMIIWQIEYQIIFGMRPQQRYSVVELLKIDSKNMHRKKNPLLFFLGCHYSHGYNMFIIELKKLLIKDFFLFELSI